MEIIFILSSIFFGISILSALLSIVFNILQQTLDDLDQDNFANKLIRKHFYLKRNHNENY